MCGILGWISPVLTDRAAARHMAMHAVAALDRRGPDDSRMECGPGWLLGHTRLAILDLSDRASQPMADRQGGWLVYNGEIYNFKELREELIAQGFRFESTGDAEVLLNALRRWGPACLGRLRGMFAFGWLDTDRRELILARDRYGVKPLAYELRDDGFRFASDLFVLRQLPGSSREVDAESAYLYMGLGYVPAPHSILKGVRKVRPGHYLRLRWGNGRFEMTEHSYWSIAQVSAAGSLDRQDGTHFLEEYEKRVVETVRYRLISDVPVGSLLSGGIDSTLVTALCREQPGADIPSFTMGFEDPRVDEAPFARALARHLGGHHTEFCIGEKDVLKVWDGLWSVFDEPFADSSALPMVALCSLVAGHVKVALSGDGGDEVFCGYPWHRALDRLDKLRVPAMLRGWTGAMAPLLSPSLRYKASLFAQMERLDQWTFLRTGLVGETARLLPVEGVYERASFREYFREWARPLELVSDPLDWACRMELLTYLPDNLMVKADRASMSVGLELREPLLDHQLTAWCLELPMAERYDRETRESKLLARRILARRLPEKLFLRPKQGFTPPLNRWLRGPLSSFVEDALERLKGGKLAPLRLSGNFREWSECASRLNDLSQQLLWRVVCFSEWLKRHACISGRASSR